MACKCPTCGSPQIIDHSNYQDNGVIGHGYRRWKISDERACKTCGTIFKPVKDNCNDEEDGV